MPQPRKYKNSAERNAAWRERNKAAAKTAEASQEPSQEPSHDGAHGGETVETVEGAVPEGLRDLAIFEMQRILRDPEIASYIKVQAAGRVKDLTAAGADVGVDLQMFAAAKSYCDHIVRAGVPVESVLDALLGPLQAEAPEAEPEAEPEAHGTTP